ncbi:MAG: peptidoglycan bridge formation glycyltransferase FemA/FemB family protein [Candidatus Saccharibacteria bacterium]|nr:peptidoglycan bridge formation glycyltransferase FemA/FemB family protein [Candidatus Saccharibacteria bacterium]
MIFKQITPEEFEKFALKSPYKIFLQTKEIANLREQSGWTPYYLAALEKNKILAATMMVAKPTFLGKSTFFAPGGPLLDLENEKIANFFLKNLKNFVKTHNGLNLIIDPYYELIERDINGNPVKNGFNRKSALKNLEKQGLKEVKDPSDPKYLFALNLENRKEDELFASFKQNTRNLIRRTERQGAKIRILEKKDLKELKKITEKTADRRNFADRSLDYYEKMYDLFSPKNEIKFLLAEVEINGKMTPLSTAMFMTYGDEVIYLFSGSDEKYMKTYNAQYLIQWEMIKFALKNGFKRYNFYGIKGLPDEKKPGYGIYRFKKGFGGQVIELVGTYELAISPIALVKKALSIMKQKCKWFFDKLIA